MKILVTGSNGFIGRNLIEALNREHLNILKFDIDNSHEELVKMIEECDFIVHLAGVNRPVKDDEFYDGNTNFTAEIMDLVKKANKNIPIIMSSSIQASLDNEYGKSKKLAEDILFNSNLPVYIYRLSNVFGKWARPNYNSVVATYCYKVAHDEEIYVRDEQYVIRFNYIEDICNEFIRVIKGNHKGSRELLSIEPIYECSLGKLASLIKYFNEEIKSLRHLPIIHNEFELKLFKTFCSYASDEGYSYNYALDNRGSFEEIFKSSRYGQISDNIIFPHMTKGGHYHTYKKEIFYTVIGDSVIRQRNINNNDLIENVVSGDKPELIDIIPNYTHEITNIKDKISHTLMWVSEVYKDETADTYREAV